MPRKRTRDEFEEGNATPIEADVDPDILERRNELITVRGALLEAIVDRHDDLVREIFHLEKFVTLISYDPAIAKEDKSEVFRQYSANYDLLSVTNAISSGRGRDSSRRTRSALNERREELVSPIKLKTPSKTPSILLNGTPSTSKKNTPKQSPNSPLQFKKKKKTGTTTPRREPPTFVPSRSVSLLPSPPEQPPAFDEKALFGELSSLGSLTPPPEDIALPFPDQLPSEPASPIPAELSPSLSPSPKKHRLSASPSPPKKKRKLLRESLPSPSKAQRELRGSRLRNTTTPGSLPPKYAPFPPPPPREKQKRGKAVPPSPARSKSKSIASSPIKRKGKGKRRADPFEHNAMSEEIPDLFPYQLLSKLEPESEEEEEIIEEEEIDPYADLPPLPPGFPRTIKLYQRPPAFAVTHPAQRPLSQYLPKRLVPDSKPLPAPVRAQRLADLKNLKTGPVKPPFFFSPRKFLESFAFIDYPQSTTKVTSDTAPPPPLSALATPIPVLEQRAQKDATLREREWNLRKEGRIVSHLHPDSSSSKHASLLTVEPNPLVKELLTSSSRSVVRDLKEEREAVLKKIDRAIHAHFANLKMNQDKKAREDVRRVKALAKAIGKFVEGEWKKAVWHVRQEYLALVQAEEARQGKIALDVVLEKSGALLGRQRGGLEVGRHGLDGEDSDDEEDEDDDDDEEEEEEEEEEGEEVEAEHESNDGGDEAEEGEEEDIDEQEGVEEEFDHEAEAETPHPGSTRSGTRSMSVSMSMSVDDDREEDDEPAAEEEDEDADLYVDPPAEQTEQDKLMDGRDDERLEEQEDEEVMSREMSLSSSLVPEEAGPEDTLDQIVNPVTSPSPPESPQQDGNNIQEDEIEQPSIASHLKGKARLVDDGQYGSTSSLDGDNADYHFEPDNTTDAISYLNGDANTSRESVHEDPSQEDDEQGIDDSMVDSMLILGSQPERDQTPIEESLNPAQDHQLVEEDLPPQSIERNSPKSVVMNVDEDVANPDVSTTLDLVDDSPNTMQGAEPSSSLLPKPVVEGPADEVQIQDNDVNEVVRVEGQTAPPVGNAEEEEEPEEDGYLQLPEHLRCYAAAVVDYDPTAKVLPPLLLRGSLRPYQQTGLEWLATLHTNQLNGILADEMGLGKTIQTIALLAHLACDRGIWGPHLIVVPTSVILNWEMEFKKFLPGFRVLSYHGNTKRRKELRVGWNNRHAFNVCVTSYTLASRDAHIFKRKPWYYFILDEAHMIKNFKSQRWSILLSFRSYRRLLLTGTPLQNNLTELWSLLRFLMSGSAFLELKEFGEWFSNPLEKAIEISSTLDQETQERVEKLHTVLRPYILRRLKKDVEKELPNKYEHIVMCRLSKRQRYLYDEFMQRAQTREALASGIYQQVANILMQLRKVCNHPDLFEVRQIVTSFAMNRSAVADYEVQDLLIRRRLMDSHDRFLDLNLSHLGLNFLEHQGQSVIMSRRLSELDATELLPLATPSSEPEPPSDTRTIDGFKRRGAYLQHVELIARQKHVRYLNRLRCHRMPIFGSEVLRSAKKFVSPLLPYSAMDYGTPDHVDKGKLVPLMIKSYADRAKHMFDIIHQFTFVTPTVVANDLSRWALAGAEEAIQQHHLQHSEFDETLHAAAVRQQIAFPDPGLLQYDCGKLQELAKLLRERKVGGHRVLIFTQMTKILDILELFLNFHGWLYLRLDGATKVEDRQYVTERFNADTRIFAFIASSRSGGVGVNLTGADTVVFFDSDFNPQMDRQCEDRAHRIGQIRDVHIYRFISEHTVEESIFRKANQKRSLDDIVIQKGEFDWRNVFNSDGETGVNLNEGLNPMLSKALGEFEEEEDARAAQIAAREEAVIVGEDKADFEEPATTVSKTTPATTNNASTPASGGMSTPAEGVIATEDVGGLGQGGEMEIGEVDEEGVGSLVDYMLRHVQRDWEFFGTWKI